MECNESMIANMNINFSGILHLYIALRDGIETAVGQRLTSCNDGSACHSGDLYFSLGVPLIIKQTYVPTRSTKVVSRLETGTRVLPLLVLVPPPALPLLHTSTTPFSLIAIPTLAPFLIRRDCTSGTAHGIEFPSTLTLYRADRVINDFARDLDSTVLFVVSDCFYFETFAIDFISVK